MSVLTVEKQKLDLIEWVMSIDDESMLKLLLGLAGLQNAGDWWDDISEPDKKSILRGIEDAKFGRVKPADAVFAKIQQRVP